MSIKVSDYLNSYEFACELPSDGRTITFKPFTTGQIKKLLAYENSDDPFIIEHILDDIITECVISEDFDLDALLLQDRFYLLLKIRERSKGDAYNYTYKCPKCKFETVGNIKISELEVSPMDVDTTPIILNDQLSVSMKLITRGEQKEVYKMLSDAKLTVDQKIVEAATMSIALSMDVFFADGEEDANVSLKDKMELINYGLPASIFELMKEWLTNNDYGIKFKVLITCDNGDCKNKELYAIPIDNFFG